MPSKSKEYPIPFSKTWNEIDSSKLTSYATCPRKFFYRYVLGWTPDVISHDLHFGRCLHLAFDYIYSEKNFEKQTLENAYKIFITSYRDEFVGKFDSDSDEYYSPKNPERFRMFLDFYAQQNKDIFNKFNVEYTEVAGTVPIKDIFVTKDFFEHEKISSIVFKIDAILRHKKTKKIYGLEHKTTKSLINNTWKEQFRNSIQINTYLYALKNFYEAEQENIIEGIIVNGLCFRKLKKLSFESFKNEKFNIQRSMTQIQIWHNTITNLINDIEKNFYLLKTENYSKNSMMCFNLNPTNCFKYFRECSYLSFCENWANPLKYCSQIPSGFKKEFWKPLEQENVKTILDRENNTIEEKF